MHQANDPTWVLPFSSLSKRDIAKVGGKGANLGEMSQAGFPVPGGFCVTTDAYDLFLSGSPDTDKIFARLSSLNPEDTDSVRLVGQEVRAQLQLAPMPPEVADAVVSSWITEGKDHFYAVRSSATAEDLPGASFAGQQDTYLHIRGKEALLQKIKDCWISLFTDRAIIYRAKNGFDHQKVALSVVVQRMVRSEISGILFTADPINGRRHIISIDAGFGLGEALVSGLVSADLYQIDKRTQELVEKKIALKKMAIIPLPSGGTEHIDLPLEKQSQPSLTEEQAKALATIANKIEAHYGQPQDIEWCIEDEQIFIVQSRPITTLFPVPGGADLHKPIEVFFSFNHVQVMTDAMPPLTQEIWRHIFPFGRDHTGLSQLMQPAGGRLYINLSRIMRLPQAKKFLGGMEKNIDALMAGAIEELIERPDFGPRNGSALSLMRSVVPIVGPILAKMLPIVLWRNHQKLRALALTSFEEIASSFEKKGQESLPPAEKLMALLHILDSTLLNVIPRFAPLFLGGNLSAALVRNLMQGRGVDRELAIFEQGLEGNATTEMDLLLGDIADLLRGKPHLIDFLQREDPKTALDQIKHQEGAGEFSEAIERFFDTYGMRGPSEIDISRPRWREDPRPLIQMLLGNITSPTPGAHRTHYNKLIAQGQEAAEKIIAAAPLHNRFFIRKLVSAVRSFVFIREHPKFLLIRALWVIKQALFDCAKILLERGQIERRDDIFFLQLPEIVAATNEASLQYKPQIEERRAEFLRYQKMSPPRAITSHGEILTRAHKSKNAPAGALIGSPASPGIIEGIAKVVLDPTSAIVESGEILIAPFTDPGWTPLFMNAKGLVMEVGGLMTHGSVVAREYGIPAVVCVPDATKKIKTGQQIRVNGDEGWVQVL